MDDAESRGTLSPTQVAAAAAVVRLAQLERQAPSFLAGLLPAPLLGVGPRGLLWWQWVALPLAAVLALALGWVLAWLTRRALGQVASRTQSTWDDLLLARLAQPVTLFWALVVASGLRPALALDAAFDDALGRGVKAGFFLAVFWGAFRAIDVAFGVLAEAPTTRSNPGLHGLVPLLRKSAKAAALALGMVAVLTELGFQVTSLLAGLGIGGLAVALAAQKTVENLIGSVAIGVDQPFRVGDYVQVDGTQGTVEVVGMRSTRIRTLDRTLVTLPNGKLADMRIESFAARDRFRLSATLGLRYATTAAQMRAILAALAAELAAHPARGPEAPVVRFVALADSSLSVEVMAWLQAADFDEFGRLRGELLLRFMEIVEQGGSGFAFPTRSLHVESLPPGAPPGAPAAPGP
ncbi:MAG: mechanosensitive ion channel [Anaeromyxobacter sp.]|nr:mechanosensitive ion channel [Anaeromyxobacter sp.]MBL0277444.1 mechanosensitive ion channel [Anaeromyxobacter sp.]